MNLNKYAEEKQVSVRLSCKSVTNILVLLLNLHLNLSERYYPCSKVKFLFCGLGIPSITLNSKCQV